jgi:hypothetical protein
MSNIINLIKTINTGFVVVNDPVSHRKFTVTLDKKSKKTPVLVSEHEEYHKTEYPCSVIKFRTGENTTAFHFIFEDGDALVVEETMRNNQVICSEYKVLRYYMYQTLYHKIYERFLKEVHKKELKKVRTLANKAVKAGKCGWEIDLPILENIDALEDPAKLKLLFNQSLMIDNKNRMLFKNEVKRARKLNGGKKISFTLLTTAIIDATGNAKRGFSLMHNSKAFSSPLLKTEVLEDHGDYEIKYFPRQDLILVKAASDKVDGRALGLEQARKWVINGISTHEYLPSSNAQTRTNSFYMINKAIGADAFMMEITHGRWAKNKGLKVTIAKEAKYEGLMHSVSTKVELGHEIRVKYITGAFLYKEDGTIIELADGDTIARRSLVVEIAEKLYGEDSAEAMMAKLGFGIQIRIGTQVKGMIYGVPDKLWNTRFKGYDLVLTKSTLKVGGPDDLPAELKQGIINVVNVFDVTKAEKMSTFMHTELFLNGKNKYEDLQRIVSTHIGYEVEDMKEALRSKEAFMNYFKLLGNDSIDVQEALKTIVGSKDGALNDELIFRSAKNQFKFRFKQMKEGKLRGCFGRCLLTDPSIWFLGRYDGKEIRYTEKTIKSCLIQPGQVFSRTIGEELLLSRSPSNHPGQMVAVKNVRYDLCDKIKIKGVTLLTSELFGTDSDLANFTFLCGYCDTRLLLAGADTDGDTIKEMILVPGEDLIIFFNGDEKAISKYVGPWRELWAPRPGFIAIGDTMFKPKSVPFSYEALKECKAESLIPKSVGIITNILFAIVDLYATLFYTRKLSDFIGLLNGNMLKVLAHMAYNAHMAVIGDDKHPSKMPEFEKLYDPKIVETIKETAFLFGFLTDKRLYKLMFGKKVDAVKKLMVTEEGLWKDLRKEIMKYLGLCIEILCHLQMIEIDAASTGNYPNMEMFNFARNSQIEKVSTSEGVANVMLTVAPTWFYSVRGKQFKPGLFKSRSVQGVIYDAACAAEKEMMGFKLKNPIRLFDETEEHECEKDISVFTDNLIQSEIVKKAYLKSLCCSDKEEKELMDKELSREVKAYMNLKVEQLMEKYSVNDLVSASYKASLQSLRKEEEGSATRASMFLRFFGPYAAALLKKDTDTMVYAINKCIPKEGMFTAEDGVIKDGPCNVLGYIPTKARLEGYIKNNMFVCKHMPEEEISLRTYFTNEINSGDTVEIKVEVKGLKSIVALYRDNIKVGEIMNKFLSKAAPYKGRKMVISYDESDKKAKTCNCLFKLIRE